jgi:hypothetical protein
VGATAPSRQRAGPPQARLDRPALAGPLRAQPAGRSGVEQAERLAQGDVLPVQEAGEGGGVVRVHVGNARRGRVERPIRRGVEVEHGDAHAGDVVGAQRALQRRLDRPQVLADQPAAVPPRLEARHREQLVEAVVHVGAVARRHAAGDPPQPRPAKHVVDPQRRGVRQRVAQAGAQHGVAGLAVTFGVQRGEAPVLPLGEEHVRWCADGRTGSEGVREGPGVVPLGGAPDRQVEQISASPRRQAGGVGGELVVHRPLGVAVTQHRSRRDGSWRDAPLLPGRRPACAVGAVHLDRRPETRITRDIGVLAHEAAERRAPLAGGGLEALGGAPEQWPDRGGDRRQVGQIGPLAALAGRAGAGVLAGELGQPRQVEVRLVPPHAAQRCVG